MKRYTNEVLSVTTGLSVIGATVAVFLAGTTTLATLYAEDDPLSTPTLNPFATGFLGEFEFYADDGVYDLRVTRAGRVVVLPNVELVDLVAFRDLINQIPVGPSDSTFTSLASLKAANPLVHRSPRLAAPAGTDGGVANGTFSYQTGNFTGRTDVVQVDGVPLSTGALVRTAAGSIAYGLRTAKSKLDEHISPFDTQYNGGAVGDGIADDTMAITMASAVASITGRSINVTTGKFAVANARLPTAGAGDPSYVAFVGDPVFVQLTPNTPCIATQISDSARLQSVGHRFSCTVIPHIMSDKANAANIAIDATGMSSSDIRVTLGTATSYTSTSGRFNTIVGARSDSPFHYGNRIHVIANACPAPKYGIRYTNGGAGAAGNPNINQVSGYFNALDTIAGDIMIDVGDSTQVKVCWPTLLEACPNATGVRAGNFCHIQGVWFENITGGVDIDFVGTASTTPNNCRVSECQFSGGGHVILIRNDLGAPPRFEDCIGDDTNVTYRDQFGATTNKPASIRSRAQPSNPTITFTVGGGTVVANTSGVASRVDHHGVTTCQTQYFVTPTATGSSQLRIVPPSGYVIDQASVGVRDGTTNVKFAAALGDNIAGTDFDFAWVTTNLHAVNVRVTMRAVL